jgi:tetratricopeptide (TPR) repeat protein
VYSRVPDCPVRLLTREFLCRQGSVLLLVAGVLVALAGCSRPAPPKRVRMAVLPVENLTSDAALDWMAVGAARVLATDLAGSRSLDAGFAGAERDSAALGANRVLRGFFTAGSGGGVRFEADIQDAETHRSVQHLAATAADAPSAIAALDAMAKSVDAGAIKFPTRDGKAFQAWAQAFGAGAPQQMAALFETAVHADPNFPLAWTGWIEALRASGDGAGALRVVEQSKAAKLPAADRARIDYLGAELTGDPARRSAALEALSKAEPGDLTVVRALAETFLRRRRFREAEAEYRRVAEMEPRNAANQNTLAYAAVYAGDWETATSALREYERLAPGNPNLYDTSGEVHYVAGRFGEAERFFLQAYEKDPTFLQGLPLYKAAMARLLTGDRDAADGLFNRFLEARRKNNDALAAVREARWKRMTGRHQEAQKALESAAAAGSGPAASLAGSELALWSAFDGHMEQARQWASRAAQGAGNNPQVRLAAFIAQFATSPPAAAGEWRARAERALNGPAAAGPRALALGLVLTQSHQWADAAAAWNTLVVDNDPGAVGEFAVLAAWALLESGQKEAAKALVERWPLAPPSGDQMTTVLAFPRVLDVRARAGVGEATREAELFRKYSESAR